MEFETAVKILKEDAEFLGITDFIKYLEMTNENWLSAPVKIKQALDTINNYDSDTVANAFGVQW